MATTTMAASKVKKTLQGESLLPTALSRDRSKSTRVSQPHILAPSSKHASTTSSTTLISDARTGCQRKALSQGTNQPSPDRDSAGLSVTVPSNGKTAAQQQASREADDVLSLLDMATISKIAFLDKYMSIPKGEDGDDGDNGYDGDAEDDE
ncbi:unnamed protein product [Zymoseptoria tritici ST99CH_3D7]|uniref:Uncharacterized protein n=1 Tax=Zymoseptoria tritici (strain ST99CH_3D7) TaxID=1276538 RepID=A0A1X7S9T7_ZYMT9|nr:unnamed protein product [Zymoseptoria tritici ST99CH_3D7]